MPIFEYRCRACGAQFERIHAASVTAVTCVQCASPQVERLLSVFAVGSSPRSGGASADDPCARCGARERGSCPG